MTESTPTTMTIVTDTPTVGAVIRTIRTVETSTSGDREFTVPVDSRGVVEVVYSSGPTILAKVRGRSVFLDWGDYVVLGK